MNESTDTAARERLEALIGEWALEAGPPGGPPWPGAGRVTFDWLDGTPLLVARSHVDEPGAPDGVSVIGCDGISGTYHQLYTDDRDVQRIYEMSLRDGVWKLWRAGQPFSQRFTGTFSDDGRTIAGLWETETDGRWTTDFELTYTKVD
jgi:hypothetical protein